MMAPIPLQCLMIHGVALIAFQLRLVPVLQACPTGKIMLLAPLRWPRFFAGTRAIATNPICRLPASWTRIWFGISQWSWLATTRAGLVNLARVTVHKSPCLVQTPLHRKNVLLQSSKAFISELELSLNQQPNVFVIHYHFFLNENHSPIPNMRKTAPAIHCCAGVM